MPVDVDPDEALDRARRLLDPRLEPIRQLAAARAARNEARKVAEKAETTDARAYAAAVKAGWTEAELRSVGFDAPSKRLPGRPAGGRSNGQATPDAANGAEDVNAGGGEQQTPA